MESTERDREVLRERVRSILEATNRTQKQLESELGWSSGTVTRVFGGRKALDAELLGAMARALATTPAELVAGTAFTSLLGESAAPAAPVPAPQPPPAPEPPRPPPVAEALLSAPEPKAARTSEPAPAREPAPAEPPKAEAPKVEAPKTEPAAAAPSPPPPPAEPAPAAATEPEDRPGLVGRILRFFGRIRGR